MGAPRRESKHSQPERFGTTLAVRRVRRFPGRVAGGVGVAGLVALGLMSAPAPAASDGQARALGRVTAVAWSVRTPVGARLVLRPFVTLNVQQRELRALDARKPRVSATFVARFVTRPTRGPGRTLAVVSRRARGLAIRASSVRRLGRPLQLKRLVLTRRQTRRIKRASKRHRLAIIASIRYRVRYTDARGHTVVTPLRSARTTLRVGLTRPKARGASLRQLAARLRTTMQRLQRSGMGCATRNTIMGRLRSTYTMLVSGRRWLAADELRVWIDYARTMRRAGVLSATQARMLRSGLGAILRRVGSGQSKRVERARRWPRLPTCAPTGARSRPGAVAHSAQGVVATSAVMKVLSNVFKKIHAIGHLHGFTSSIVSALWPNRPTLLNPNQTDPSIYDFYAQAYKDLVEEKLNILGSEVYNFLDTEQTSISQPGVVLNLWANVELDIASSRVVFADPNYDLDKKLDLMPLFSQYETLYLSFLREAIVNGPQWGALPDYLLNQQDKLDTQLESTNPADPDADYTAHPNSAVTYVNKFYKDGMPASSSNPEQDYKNKREYLRDMQLEILDVRDMWRFENPMATPYGDPTFRLTRMIYTDDIGDLCDPRGSDCDPGSTFALPPNVSSPLPSIKAWTSNLSYWHYWPDGQNWLRAFTSGLGPIMGDVSALSSTPETWNVAPDENPGPVEQVDATWEPKDVAYFPQHLVQSLKFSFSKGGAPAIPGGTFFVDGSQTTSWAFDDHVLATVKIMGAHKWDDTHSVSNSAVFGFRVADSFSNEHNGSLAGQMRSWNSQACLAVERTTITDPLANHVGVTTGSRSKGASLELRACSPTQKYLGWEQIWSYVDYNDPDDPDDDAHQGELNVYSGSLCAAPKPDVAEPPIPVQVLDCDTSSTQKWERRADGSVRPHLLGSNLCLERKNGAVTDGTPVQLNECVYSSFNGVDTPIAAQRWTWPTG